jgi:zona occludens toxin
LLTLFTGVPGSGKSAAGVELLTKLLKDGSRPLFVVEIPEENVPPISLKIPHTLIGPDAPDPELRDPTRWHELVPDGAVVFMPEAQRLWPARAPSAKVPVHVEAVGQHRHRTLELVIDTQHPKLLDDKVRLRVGRHVHIRDLGFLGRHWYEFPEVTDPGQWRSAPIKARYRLPKRVFKLYTSATSHIKPVRRIPPSVYVLGVCLVAVVALTWRVVSSISDKVSPTASMTAPGAGAAAGSSSSSHPFAGSRRAAAPGITGPELVLSLMPRLSDVPHSAPAYDHLRRVVAMPRVQGGYCIGSRCSCVLQHGLPAPISDRACRELVLNPQFDPYHLPEPPRPTRAGPASVADQAEPLAPRQPPVTAAGV